MRMLTIVNMTESIQKQNSVLAATRLTKKDEETINRLIKSGVFMNMSDFIREAVREKLERLGETKVVFVRGGITKEQAKKEIMNYAKKHPGSYVSDAADALGIDIVLAFEAARELREDKGLSA